MKAATAIHRLDDILPNAPFRERHTRNVELPLEQVWPATLSCEADQIRVFGPLMKLRMLPGRVTGRKTALDDMAGGPMLDLMAHSDFDYLRYDENPIDGRGAVFFGAIGKFWKPIGNTPIPIESVDDYLNFDEPDYAIIAASIEAIDRGDYVELVTETRVGGTDRSATRKFAPYWALIRLPSGLIRRSWLAAIERTARGSNLR